MKSLILSILICLASLTAFTQSSPDVPIQNVSTDSNVVYRLFSKKNIYTFNKLNTRNGQMWQVQWSTKSNQFETILSDISRVYKDEEKNGRFFLYPTTNIYNFILLDQVDGRTWQVQWSIEPKERMVIRIY